MRNVVYRGVVQAWRTPDNEIMR